MTNQANCVRQTDEQRYRYIFEHAPICIFVIDLTMSPAIIQEANRQAELVYGYPSAKLVGKPVTLLAPDERLQAIPTIIKQIQQGQRVTAEITAQHRDGTRFPARVMATPDPTEVGRMILTVEDISAEKLQDTEKQRRSEAEAIQAERLRIAHEIHDGVAQRLAGLRFKLSVWAHLLSSAPPGMRAALDELLVVLTDAITDLRRSIFALRPLDLEALGFFPAITQLVRDYGEQNQQAAYLEVYGSQGAMPVYYELPLFRIIKEDRNARNLEIRRNRCGCDPIADPAE